ncbi:LOW QUALITY PROTEIN: autophagy-related protein 18g-like [Curcuma longa]|uniref:LOW QUALITY PROTEIN: autophagy-related protein 18g-like n=1 Tax=Curcuma longa TaxID=136217 RepID=UPI003D9E58E3
MTRGKGKNGLLPSSLRIISSCLKTVSSNAGTVASSVRSAGASVAGSIASPTEDEKDQVLWAGFDKLELGPSSFKHVLLLGYSNGFQVLDVEDAASVCELVSKRDGPVTFLQMQPTPISSEATEGFRASHPMLLVVAGDETNGSGVVQGGRLSALIRENSSEPQAGSCVSTPTVVRFYSLKSHSYIHVLRFRSAVYIVRCSSRIVAVALAAQIYCFDAVTLENKFSVLTYPLQGAVGVNIGCGPMAVGPRWLAYASNNPLISNTGRLSPQNLTPSPGVSPSTSPSSGNLVARYAMESSKTLAAGIINLGDMGYKTLSKYCQELRPDGSNSPLSPSAGRRSGRFQTMTHPSEPDNAGMVVIKDFVSKEVISQFRAHNSPISALCFDPSGTLLVTASVHGHNINIFRIMPTRVQNSSNPACYDWMSSHVHLYKLYRGLTAAVIQDVSFSHYSQWISVVSSRGTSHIYALSPFGGDACLQPQTINGEGPILTPNLTSPWWSASCCVIHQQLHPPPSPITYSVISRIKNFNSGWLNTVSNVAASAVGKASVPSGAIAAVFHNSLYHDSIPGTAKENFLEHILVYSPSGHVVQHELLPSSLVESTDSSLKAVPAPLFQVQDEELRVNSEPVQWWDVCRRSNWPEREENISQVILYSQQNSEKILDPGESEDNETSYAMSTASGASGAESVRSERSHWFLSNAEVQINSGKIPIWQRSKICFCIITPSEAGEVFATDHTGGEIAIEKLHFDEVEMRRKDLLPVFEQFRGFQSQGSDRVGGIYRTSSSVVSQGKYEFSRNTANHSFKTSSRSDFGTRPTSGLLDFDDTGGSGKPVILPSMQKAMPSESGHGSSSIIGNDVAAFSETKPTTAPIRCSKDYMQLQANHSPSYSIVDGCIDNGVPARSNSVPCNGRLADDDGGKVPESYIPSNRADHAERSDSNNSVEFVQYFDEGYCKVSELDDCRELTEAVDADSNSSHCEREKPEEDGDNNDEMVGGVFAFCEEG